MKLGQFYVHSRRSWNARPWKDFTSQDHPSEAFVHHGAETDREAQSVGTLAEIYVATREVQNFHMDTRGWFDIAYHYLVFQAHGQMRRANACEGRPVSHVPAAQLNHNTGTLAICVFGTIDSGDQLRDDTVELIGRLIKLHHVPVVGGHRDVVSTDCPGDTLYHALDRIAHAAGARRF